MLPVINFSYVSLSHSSFSVPPAPFPAHASQAWTITFPAVTGDTGEKTTQSADFAGDMRRKAFWGPPGTGEISEAADKFDYW